MRGRRPGGAGWADLYRRYQPLKRGNLGGRHTWMMRRATGNANLHETLHIDILPLTEDPLPAPIATRPWEPWLAKTAAASFLAKLKELTTPGGCTHGCELTDITGAIARERKNSDLAVAFTGLPPGSRRRCAWPLTGDSLTDTFVLVETGDRTASIEGVVVDGERDDDGAWDFDAPFTVLTMDEKLIVCRGDCYVEIQ